MKIPETKVGHGPLTEKTRGGPGGLDWPIIWGSRWVMGLDWDGGILILHLQELKQTRNSVGDLEQNIF